MITIEVLINEFSIMKNIDQILALEETVGIDRLRGAFMHKDGSKNMDQPRSIRQKGGQVS